VLENLPLVAPDGGWLPMMRASGGWPWLILSLGAVIVVLGGLLLT
jgi:hypothetical protein